MAAKFPAYFYNRKLRLDILSFFLLLITLSLALIIIYSYKRNADSIQEFSLGTIERVNSLIEEKTETLFEDLSRLPEITSGLLIEPKDLSADNKELIAFMFNTLTIFPELHALFIGTEKGLFIKAGDLRIVTSNFYLSDPEKPLPADVFYGLYIVDHGANPPKEIVKYKNQKLETVAEETLLSLTYDPRNRPWYQGAKKSGTLFWSEPFDFISAFRGVSVSKPLYDKKGQLMGVVGADLPLKVLHIFLSSLKIGKTGKAFIVDQNGDRIAPKEAVSTQKITQKMVDATFATYLQQKVNNFEIVFKGTKYLASVNPIPEKFKLGWYTVILVPRNDFFADLLETQLEIFFISLIILIIAAILVVYFSKKISSPIVRLTKEVDKIRRLDLEDSAARRSHIREIAQLEDAIASTRKMLRSFGHYVPKEIVRDLMEKGEEIILGGERKEMTILFTDIENFTAISEITSVDVLMPLLSEYFDLVSNIILECEGTIDKYIGDSVMAFWGAPKEVKEHAKMACKAALMIKKNLAILNQKRKKNGLIEFPTRIGIHTGIVTVGNIGTSDRMNYTVMGDAVNTATRLEQINKIYHTEIVISEEVVKRIDEQFTMRHLDTVTVKGKREQIKIFELLDEKI